MSRVFVCLGYLAPLMQAFLGDGSRWGVTIVPVIEQTPLGTAGGLRAIEGLGENFFVINGDTLTDLSFQAMADLHPRPRCLGHALHPLGGRESGL